MDSVPRLFLFLLVLCFSWVLPASVPCVYGQADDPAKKPTTAPDPKAEAVLARAIEVLGGNNYLNLKTVVGRGYYTTFNDGVSQLPARFLDYIAFPDKERTEFSGGGIKIHPNQRRRHRLAL